MKNILIFIALVISVGVFGQAASKLPNRLTAADPAVTSGPGYHYFWGTTNDTIVASQTLNQVFRIKGDGLLNLSIQMDMTKVSGTVTNNIFIERSIDGVTWTRVDTVVYSNASTGVTLLSDSEYTNWNWPYLRLQAVAPATTQKAWYKGWLMIRY